jgi:hypothetical protein
MSSSKTAARTGIVLGALAVLAVPAGVVASRFVKGVTLLEGLYYSVPAAVVLGLLALVAVRRARLSAQRSVFSDRRGPVRTARTLAWLGLYIGVTSGIAVGVYWALRARH